MLEDSSAWGNSFISAAEKLFKNEAIRSISNGTAFEQIEQQLLESANELARRATQHCLQQLAQLDPPALKIRDVTHRRHHLGKQTFHSLCGPIEVECWSYRAIKQRNAKTCLPLEKRAQLLERCTPALAKALAFGQAQLPSRRAREHLELAYRRPPSRSTVDRVARRLGHSVAERLSKIEAPVRATESIPETTCAASIGLDRTSIPMEETTEGTITVHYRMAYVATIGFFDSRGNCLKVNRYAAPSEMGPSRAIEGVMSDLDLALEQRKDLKIGVVQDGAKELWTLVEDSLRQRIKHWDDALDFYHASEHLAELLQMLPFKNWLVQNVRLKEQLLNETNGARKMLSFLRPYVHRLTGRQRKAARREYRYFSKRMDKLNYAATRAQGLPVGSGATEGACKSLIKARVNRSGQRWHLKGANGTLALRGLCENERFDHAWREFIATERVPIGHAA